MKVVIGSDPKRAQLKEEVKGHLKSNGIEFDDFGESDYVTMARGVSQVVADGSYSHGILICRTGIGMQIVANKTPGAYAVRCHDLESARDSRQINDANILTFGEKEEGLAREIVKTWLGTQFSGEPKYVQAIDQIKNMEKYYHGFGLCL